jgi:hypothetical protein
MKRRFWTKLLVVASMTCATTFQATSCSVLSNDQLATAINTSAQGFLNSIFAQMLDGRIDGVLHVK